MVTPPDIEAQILRYYHAETWTAGTIGRQLNVHHSVVRRVLGQAGLPRIAVYRARANRSLGLRSPLVGHAAPLRSLIRPRPSRRLPPTAGPERSGAPARGIMPLPLPSARCYEGNCFRRSWRVSFRP
jgi:hypothetical protein